jgi:uncharacterized protein YfaS (alpha-2-macroglobulin family)
VRRGDLGSADARPLATWLLQVRRAGAWRSTQENAWALIALATYRREIEGRDRAPVTVAASVGATTVLEAALDGEHDPASRRIPMSELLGLLGPARTAPVGFTATGPRPAFYTARLEVARSSAGLGPLDRGFAVEREYAIVGREAGTPITSVAAGELVRVTLRVRTPESRFLVAVSDPLPGGFEAVDPELASASIDWRTADLRSASFDHVELRDARVNLFATYLHAGIHEVRYLARATTPGTFFAAAPTAEAMYEPEVSGRGSGTTITVTPQP